MALFTHQASAQPTTATAGQPAMVEATMAASHPATTTAATTQATSHPAAAEVGGKPPLTSAQIEQFIGWLKAATAEATTQPTSQSATTAATTQPASQSATMAATTRPASQAATAEADDKLNLKQDEIRQFIDWLQTATTGATAETATSTDRPKPPLTQEQTKQFIKWLRATTATTTQPTSQAATAAASVKLHLTPEQTKQFIKWLKYTMLETVLTPEQIDAEQQFDAINDWWEANWQWFAWIGGIALAITIGIMGAKLIRWLREEASEEDVDEGEPLSSGGPSARGPGGGPGGGGTEVVTTEQLVEISRPRQATFRCGTLLYSKKGLVFMFAWMLWGDFVFTMMESVASSALNLKFKAAGASNTTMGLVLMTIPNILGFCVTPTLCVWSDRVRTRWGRRLPFIITTLPFLTLSLVLLAYCDDIGMWIHHAFFSGSPADKAKVMVVVLSFCVCMFNFFNLFVNTVYWMLFNDVVPQKMMGRFTAYFKLIGTLTSMLYMFFIYQFALSHMKQLYLAAAVLYALGFGVMCLRVKESDYPPPEDAAPKPQFKGLFHKIWYWIKHLWDILANLRKSLSIRHYVYMMLEPAIVMLASGTWMFQVFTQQSMGLSLGNIGILTGVGMLMSLGFYTFVGQLVDRWHCVRAYAYVTLTGPFAGFAAWTWLFVAHPNPLVYMVVASLGGVFWQPACSIGSTAAMPRGFALVPKEKLGQYSGAGQLIRSFAALFAGLIAGVYMDVVFKVMPSHPEDPNWGYRYIFILQAVTQIGTAWCTYKVFRGWKRLGGEKSYVPPTKQFRLRDLPPHPDTNGKVNWPLLAFCLVFFAGIVITSAIWLAYYYWWHYNAYYAMIFSIALVTNIALTLAYVWCVKFMERR